MTLSWNMAERWAGRFDFGPVWRARRVGCGMALVIVSFMASDRRA